MVNFQSMNFHKFESIISIINGGVFNVHGSKKTIPKRGLKVIEYNDSYLITMPTRVSMEVSN